jgi:hypothetical protein
MARDNYPLRRDDNALRPGVPQPSINIIYDVGQSAPIMECIGQAIGLVADGASVQVARALAYSQCPQDRDGAAAYRDKAARLKLAAEAVASEMIDAASAVLNRQV